MNYDIYKNRRTAIVFRGPHRDLPAELASWEIADLDAFHEHLDMWCPPEEDPMEMFFSAPFSGIPTHKANVAAPFVGVAGEMDSDVIETLKSQYLMRGYDVVTVLGNNVDYTQSDPDNKVRIVWD